MSKSFPKHAMTIVRYTSLLILALLAGPALGGDANGYTAQYECRAGGPHCNVDIATLTSLSRPCQQVVYPSTSWNSVDWSKDVICIAAGDHAPKGDLTLRSSGESGAFKVLRYYRDGDSGDEPWNQLNENQAKLSRILTGDAKYWIIHRLTFPSTSASSKILVSSGNDIIINRVFATGITGPGDNDTIEISGGTNIWVQNSVIGPCVEYRGASLHGIGHGNTTGVRIVNNEIYNCAKGIATWEGARNTDHVIENNDVYVTPSKHTNCSGTYTESGECSISKNLVSIRMGGTSSTGIVRYVHNRLWGSRPCDTTVSCSGDGGGGGAFSFDQLGSPVSWALIKNNVIMDVPTAIEVIARDYDHARASYIGNLVYKAAKYDGRAGGIGIYLGTYGVMKIDSTEALFNTIIDAQSEGWIRSDGNITNSDISCNVVIASAAASLTSGSGTQVQDNLHYELKLRANSTTYSQNDIIRLSSNPSTDCTSMTDSDCFLYKVTAAGTSAGSNPHYCTTLGCTMTDGTMTVQAIRGPYTVYRKLRTIAGGEPKVFPYALPHKSALEAGACPATAGSRPGIGARTGALL